MNYNINTVAANNWIQVSSNTPTIVNTLNILPNSTCRADAKVTVIDQVNNKCAMFHVASLIKNVVTGGVLVGSSNIIPLTGDPSLSAVQLSFVVSGNSVSLQVRGLPATVLDVAVQMTIDMVVLQPTV